MPRIFNQTVRTTNTPHDLRPVRVYTADRTLREGDGTIIADTSGGDITFSLPTAALCEGRLYTVVKKVAAGTVVVESTGVDTIGYSGLMAVQLTAIDEQVSFISGGSENVWYACACGEPQSAEQNFAMVTTLGTGAGSFAVTPSSQYLMLGTCSSPTIGKGTISDAQFRTPKAFRATRIFVNLNSALAGDDTLTCQLNVNGTADSGISVVHTAATGTLEDASGSVSVPEDALVCYEFSFGGGLASQNLLSVTLAYALVG